MNLADYLSELLGMYDEVSVPGLGYFARTRVNAYYNEREGRFYPPYHQVKFVPQAKDDDTFTTYVADKKNISLASSKYFTEKFVSKLKEEASKGKYLFADLGLFYLEQGHLTFKPNDKISADPAFYGYPQLSVSKSAQTGYNEPAKSAVPEPAPANTAPVQPAFTQPAQPSQQHNYYDIDQEEAEPRRRMSIWLILLIILAALAIIALGVYKFYPQVFDNLRNVVEKITGKTALVAPVVHRVVKIDTLKKKDSTVKAVAPIDTIKGSRFEVIASGYMQWARVTADVAKFKAEGLNAKTVDDAPPGPIIKITVGTFRTYQQADSARLALLKAGKIDPNKFTERPLEIKPKK